MYRMYRIGALMLSLCVTGCVEQSYANKSSEKAAPSKDKMVSKNVLNNLKLTTLDGKILTDRDLGGRVVLVVNVASQCGFTSQYAGLQGLHEKYSTRGLTVIGVPCNQFGGQEPGAPDEILAFTKNTYGVTFPLLTKQNVKGSEQSPFLGRLVQQSNMSSDVRWNFEKFVIDRKGHVIARFGSSTRPDHPELIGAIEKALAQ